MQEFTKISTFLLQKRNEKKTQQPSPPDEKAAQQGKQRAFPKQRREESVEILLPAISYEVCLRSSSQEENVVVRTVRDLARLYEGLEMDRGKLYQLIAEKTCLHQSLVKMILREEKNQRDVESGELCPQVQEEFYRFFFDPILQRPYPYLMKESDFIRYSSVEKASPPVLDLKNGLSCVHLKQHMSESHFHHAWVLNWDFSEEQIPLNPPFGHQLERRYLKHPGDKLLLTGVVESVGLLSRCYLSSKDLSRIHVENPLQGGQMDLLYEDILKCIREAPEENQELKERMEELQHARKQRLSSVETFSTENQVIQEKVARYYPDIKSYPELLDQMSRFISNYEAYCKSAIGSDTDLQRNDAGELYNAFHSVMEHIFAESLVKHLPKGKGSEMETLLAPLNTYRDPAPYFAEIAERSGLDNKEACRDFFVSEEGHVRIKTLKNILHAAFLQGEFPHSLPELVLANMLEAVVSEQHPFREAVRRCPRLLQVVERSRELRNLSKHSGGQWADGKSLRLPEARQVTEMRALVETMLDVLLIPRSNTKEELAYNQQELENRKAAMVKAREEVDAYSGLVELHLEEPAQWLSYCFHYQDPEYFSACYNLLGKLLDLLLEDHSTRASRKETADLFSGEKLVDEKWIHGLFQSYGCDYEANSRPNTKKIKAGLRHMEAMSTQNKGYLAFALLDREDPAFLKSLLAAAPDFPALIDTVCHRRGHSEVAKFDEDPEGYARFHKSMMKRCDAFCGELLKGC